MAPCGTKERHGTALLIASSPSHELDRTQQPNPLLMLGGVSMASHAVWQLNTAGFLQVVVVVGFQGNGVRESISATMSSESSIFAGLRIEYIDLGNCWRGGRLASIVKASDAVLDLRPKITSLMIVGTDHIFDKALLEEAAEADPTSCGDDASVLVETDIEGMVGLPPSTVFCAMRPLHGSDRIYSIGPDIETYSGIEAGLIVLSTSALYELMQTYQVEDYHGARMNVLLQRFAQRGTLRMIKTSGRTWFSVETLVSAAFSSHGLQKVGYEYTLADGQKVHFVGLPQRLKTSASNGGEWAEFNVSKWRSAMFTANCHFQQVYSDTTDFISKLIEEKGGSEKVLVVEVGCGTGEALIPLFPKAKYCVGLDCNPHFIEFCKENVPPEFADKVIHITGDAQNLLSLARTELPEGWCEEERPKVIMCVCNTIGIMPADVRRNVYRQMLSLAGRDGFVVVVYWNGNKFGDGVQNFYHKNPQLCGTFTGECIDLNTCTLTTPNGYYTHWTKPEEARQVFECELEAEVVLLRESGNGVFLVGRARA